MDWKPITRASLRFDGRRSAWRAISPKGRNEGLIGISYAVCASRMRRAEVEAQMTIAVDLGLASPAEVDPVLAQAQRIGRMLNGLMARLAGSSG